MPAAALEKTAVEKTSIEPRPDGRTARGERTRRQLAESLIALLEAGVPDPTAKQVAERAGVSLRLVFHHFDDMEQLLRSAVSVQVERHWSHLSPVDPGAPLAERVSQVARQREALFESISPVRRAAARIESGSRTISAQLTNARAVLREGLEAAFVTELSTFGKERAEVLDALEAAASWEQWELLRRRMELRPVAARRVMARTLLSLLACSP